MADCLQKLRWCNKKNILLVGVKKPVIFVSRVTQGPYLVKKVSPP